MKFYKCKQCGNLIEMITDNGLNPSCCNTSMEELIPNEVDASLEKHIPLIKEEDGKVTVIVGETMHPMIEEHYIEWIVVHTDQGYYRKRLKPGNAPIAEFALLNNEIVFSAYAYCNLHGLWKKSND